MKHSSGTAPKASFLFNQDFYLKNHTASALYFFDQSINPNLLCSIVEVSPGNFVSGYCAPFAGIECRDVQQLQTFVGYIKETCKTLGATSITLRQAPVCYQSTSAAIHEALMKNGFQLKFSDTNQHILVTDAPFQTILDDQKKRRLAKLKATGARVEILNHIDSETWYDLYVQSRVAKDFPVTISKEAYMDLSSKLSDTYQYAGVYLEDTLLANAVFVKVNQDVLYYFLAASDADYASLSPSVLVLEAMYELAQKQQYKILDLGISSVDGQLNEGLHLFKKHVGAIDSQKNTYEFVF